MDNEKDTLVLYQLYFKNTKTNKYELCEERKSEKSLNDLIYKVTLISEQDALKRPTWYGRVVKPEFDISDYRIRVIKVKITKTILEERWI